MKMEEWKPREIIYKENPFKFFYKNTCIPTFKSKLFLIIEWQFHCQDYEVSTF